MARDRSRARSVGVRWLLAGLLLLLLGVVGLIALRLLGRLLHPLGHLLALAALGRPLLVGSSLGGYYATHLAERHGLRALLINPAVRVQRYFARYLGPQHNYYSGESWELTAAHVAALAELEVPPPQDPARFVVWLQTGDETLDYRDAADYYRLCAVKI